jgi:DNA-binding transcriptional MerR regulator
MGSIIRINTPAKAAGYHVEMIRYFKKEGLIFSAKKAPNGYGIYFDRHLKVLHLIHNAKI